MTQTFEHALGLSWVMDEPMERGSHALVDDGRVWLVDPVAELGAPAGVVQLLDRHNRDCTTVAAQLGVPHFKVPDAVPGSPFEVRWVLRRRFWREVALWWPAKRALVVAEALGTTAAFAVGAGPVGIHPMLRPRPPHGLKGLNPEHLLVGHGPPVSGPDVGEAIDTAIDHAWRDTPRLLLKLPSLILANR
jgi:hypothetical protein